MHECFRALVIRARMQMCIHLPSSPPYRPAVCRASGSPPRISAAPPRRCEPLWRRLANKSCRGCRCRAAAPRIQPPPGGLASIQTADAQTQHPHLKGQNSFFVVMFSFMINYRLFLKLSPGFCTFWGYIYLPRQHIHLTTNEPN